MVEIFSACGGINQFCLGFLDPGGLRIVHNHQILLDPVLHHW